MIATIMMISSPCVVSLTWRLEDAQGVLIDELTEPMEFLVGGDDLLPKVEDQMRLKQTKDQYSNAKWPATIASNHSIDNFQEQNKKLPTWANQIVEPTCAQF